MDDETVVPLAYPWNWWSLAAAGAKLMAGVAHAFCEASQSLGEDVLAAWNFHEGQRRFALKAGHDIEQITEVD